jgi:hypothetical protein
MSGVIGNPATSNSITMTIGTLTPTLAVTGNNTICAGGTATFTASPTNGGTLPAYQWQVDGVNAGTNSPTYTSTSLTNGQVVTCILTSNLNCASPSTATSNSVTIIVTPSATLPFIENFEGTTFPPTGWTVLNPDAPSIAWGTQGAKGLVRRSAVGNTGSTSGCAGIECWNYPDTLQVDNLISKSISLSGASNAKMTFKRAYKYYNSSSDPSFYHDELRIYVSTDCGATYGSALYYKKGVQLATNGTTNNSFTPSATADWLMDSVSLAAFSGQSIIVKFEITNRYGNNLYIDDINITAPTFTPTASVAISANGSTAICSGASVTFTAAPTNGGTNPSYQWQVNGSNVGTNSPTYTTSSLTNGQMVTCIMTSNMPGVIGNPATSNVVTITINPPVVPSVSTSETTGTNPACAGSSVTFTASPTNGGSAPAYQWQVNGANVGSNSSSYTSTTLANNDVVTCILTSDAACANPTTATSSGITMTINPAPAAPTVTQNGNVLTSSSATGNQWYLNGNAISGATSQTYTCTSSGNYTVVVTGVGCPSPQSNVIPFSNQGVEELTAGVGFSIYPNPNSGNFELSFYVSVRSNYKIELTNALGQLVYKEELNNYMGQYSKSIDISDYGKGVYSIRLTGDDNKKQSVKRVVVN